MSAASKENNKMNATSRRVFQFTVLVSALALQVPAWASGLILYEVGSDNVGLANAGAAARAQNPGTLASNIAGMSFLPGTQISAGVQLLHSNLEFSQDADSNVSGRDSGTAMEWAPGGALFVTHQLDENWHVGFASYGDFGLSIDYENAWSGRYFMQNGELLGMTLLPSLAYRLDEHWSFGIGLRAMYAMFDTQLAVDNSPLDILDRPDGKLSYKDSDWGFGANLGLIYQPRPDTRIGLSYTSEIAVEFSDALKLEGAIMKVVDDQLGAVARPARVRFVSVLPKTRSGKLLRRAMQAVCEGRDPGDLTTMEDPTALQQVRDAVSA